MTKLVIISTAAVLTIFVRQAGKVATAAKVNFKKSFSSHSVYLRGLLKTTFEQIFNVISWVDMALYAFGS